MLKCISSAAEVAGIPVKGLAVLESNIDSCDEIVRSLSFRGLRAAQEKGVKSAVFELWCNNFITELKPNINHDVQPDLEQLQILVSLKFIDFDKIAKKPENEWKRELLLSDLLARFKTSEGDKFSFYKNWLDIEGSKQFHKKSVEILKALRSSQINAQLSFAQLNDVLRILRQIDFETANNILLNSADSYKDFKQKWAEKLISARLVLKISKSYLERIACNICKKFNSTVVEMLLHSIRSIGNLKEFELLLDFADVNQIKAGDIISQRSSVKDLHRSLEIRILRNLIKRSVDRNKLTSTLGNLLDKKWTFEQLSTILGNLKSLNDVEKIEKEQILISVLEILDQYKISQINYEKVLKALKHRSEDWLKEINKIAVENNFQVSGKVKNKTELIKELKDGNCNESVLKLLEDDYLPKLVEQIQSTELESKIDLSTGFFYPSYAMSDVVNIFNRENEKSLRQPRFIAEWNTNDIAAWSRIVKSETVIHSSFDFIAEAFAVIKRSNFLHTGFHMTHAQILSCLVALHANKNQGRLLQVATGDGKSTIVSVLAIIHGLRGKKVDIITSSPVLAERDAKEKAGLYQMFGLSCADNNDKSDYIKGAKDCYKKDIVYGETSQFQFDILRDEYSLLGTLGSRTCEVAIVDEVDSMLIDDASKIARLASTSAGMDLLQPIYHYLWQRLIYMQERVVEIGGQMYLLYGKIGYEQDKIILEYANDHGDIVQISDLRAYIKFNEDITSIGQPIVDIEVFLKNHLECFLIELIKNGMVKIPNNFKDFVKNQTGKWVNNALLAFNYQENVHYIIQGGLVKPVDYNNTGIVQSSTMWTDGFHQFLQIKHNLKMTTETFTTNFLSNMGYFKRYSSNLFGLTGTLVSERVKELLSKVYNVDLVKMPSLHEKQYLELPTVVVANEIKWLNEICCSALNEANKERGTLIICETIEHTRLMADKLREKYRAGAIKLHTMNNIDHEREIEKINPGEIIIATNLAGRGTDIKTSGIEKNGGMHVIVTFMPSNQLVEEQAFGRTARQGSCGTGQMILNAVTLMHYGEGNLELVKAVRDDFEARMLAEFQGKELKVIEEKDKLFHEFCSLLKMIRQDIRENSGIWKEIKDGVKGMVSNVMPSVYGTTLVSAIEEQWAMFLRKIDDGIISIEDAEKEYENFKTQMEDDYKSDNLIKNPYYLIAIANDLVVNDSSLVPTYDRAMSNFNKAIKLDKNCTAAAFVGKAWLLLKGRKRLLFANNQSINYKHQAIGEFDKAFAVLQNEMGAFSAVQYVLQQNPTYIKSDLCKQLVQKVNILGSYMNCLQSALWTIKKSQRLIDVTGIKYYSNATHNERADGDYVKRNDYDNKICKLEKYFDSFERNTEWSIDKEDLFNSYDEFQIGFNDLTVREDSGTIDQAIDTILRAFGNCDHSSNLLNKAFQKAKNFFNASSILDADKYKSISINLKGIDAERLQSLLNPDIEIKAATKEVALSQLKDKSSFFHRHLVVEGWAPDSCKINLAITLDEEIIKSYDNLQAREAIEIITGDENENSRFNLTFVNANEIWKSLQKEILPNSSLNVEFLGLDSNASREKLKEIKAENLEMEITGNKQELERAINDLEAGTVEFFNSETNVCETVYVHEANQRISEDTGDELSIKLINLEKAVTDEIIGICQEASFNVNFMAIDAEASLNGLFGGQVNVRFDKLGRIDATALIKYLRRENLEFGLVFNNLNKTQANEIIEKAALEQEDMEISKYKPLSELFMDENKPALELSEFAGRGIEYLLEINEKRFVPWRSIVSVGIIASIQMAAGVTLIERGFGATQGLDLITEGVADIFTAYRAGRSRQFTWSDYTKQKAISLVISVACSGLQPLKDAGKGVKNVVQTMGNEVLEQTGTKIIRSGKTLGHMILESRQNLKSLAFKQIGVATGQAALREGLYKVADSLSHFALEQFKPQISSSIQQKVNTKFCHSNLMKLLRKMHALDKMSKSQNLKGKIDKIVAETINPQHNFWRRQWDSIGCSLCKGILSDPKYLGSSFSMGIKIAGTLNGMHQIVVIIDNVHDQLVKKLSQIDKETLQIAQLLHKYCQIEQKDAGEIVEILKSEDIILTEKECYSNLLDEVFDYVRSGGLKEENSLGFYHEYINPLVYEIENPEYRNYKRPQTPIDKVDFGNHNQHKDKILNFCKSLHENSSSIQMDDLSMMMKSVSDAITEQIIRVTEGQLISPWSSLGMAGLSATISANIQDQLIRNSDLGKQIFSEKEAELATLRGDPNSNKDQIKALEKDIPGKQSFADAINHEAKKYTIAYSQSENIYWTQQKMKCSENTNISVRQEIENCAAAVRKDKPADLAEMFTMATENGIDLKIVDDPNYQLSEEEIEKGTEAVVFTKGRKDVTGNDGIGHYQLLGSGGEIIEKEFNGSNCGYAVFAHLTGKSVELLRNETARRIETNCEDYSKVLKAQAWIRDHYPREAQSLCFVGGKSSEEFINSVTNLAEKLVEGVNIDKENVSGYAWFLAEYLAELWKWVKNDKRSSRYVSLIVACAAFPACAFLRVLGFEDSEIMKLVKIVKDGYVRGENYVKIVVDVSVDAASKFFPASLINEIRSLGVKIVSLSETVKQVYDKHKKGENITTELLKGLTLTCSIAGGIYNFYKSNMKVNCQWHPKDSNYQEEEYQKHVLDQKEFVDKTGLPISKEEYAAIPQQTINEATLMFTEKSNPKETKTFYYNENSKVVVILGSDNSVGTCYKVESGKLVDVFKEIIDKQNEKVNNGRDTFNASGYNISRNSSTTSSHKSINSKEEGSSDELVGCGFHGKESEMGWINRYFGKYTLEAISDILFLRIKDLQIRNGSTRIFSGVFINQMQNNISRVIAKVFEMDEKTLLVPLSLYNKHAVGLIFEKRSEGRNKAIEVKYLDPLNKPMPEELKELIEINLNHATVNFKQITGSEQNYANCGPEVIENLVLYLTGHRVSQEQALELHSKLVENELVGEGNHGTHLLFKETEVMCPLHNTAASDLPISINGEHK